MATPPVPPPPPPAQRVPLFDALAVDAKIQPAANRLRERHVRLTTGEMIQAVLETRDFDYELAASMLLTGINGQDVLAEQKVEVEYLRQDQRLIIPGGLAMSPWENVPTQVTVHPVLLRRYRKIISIPYATLKQWVNAETPVQTIRDSVEAAVEGQVTALTREWSTLLADGTHDNAIQAGIVYGTISHALQMNFDVRDFGALLREDMRLSDSAWQEAHTVQKERVLNKLGAWSLQCLATLNLPQCNGYELGAWVRAYGVGCGLLPHGESKCRKEYAYTVAFGTPENWRAIVKYELELEKPLPPLCLNIIAMFGIFHLNKDHTYRSNDQNMDRIGTSYINAIRTMVSAALIDEMIANKEVVVRTAAHPFGLAQPWWLALVMGRFSLLAAPLAIRVDTTPPPVQRLMIVDAVQREWVNLPAGQYINDLYSHMIGAVRTAIASIKESPPSYSALHDLYGVTEMSKPSQYVIDSANGLMPMIYGFADAAHTDDANKKDGVALALSLSNVARDNKALSNVWANMWNAYLENMDNKGIMDFAAQAQAAFANNPPPVP